MASRATEPTLAANCSTRKLPRNRISSNGGRIQRSSLTAVASLMVSAQQGKPNVGNKRQPSTPTVRRPSAATAVIASEAVIASPCASGEAIAVEVHSLGGDIVLQAEFLANERVAAIKLQLQTATGFEVARQQLLWQGRLLKNQDVLGELIASAIGNDKSGREGVDAVISLQLVVLPPLPQEAMTAMESAEAALNCLCKRSISELRCFGKPPPECVDVCAACAFLLFNVNKKIDWKAAQKMMTNPMAFIDTCKAFNAKEIPRQTLAKVEEFLALPFFSYDVLKGKSLACAILANWIINVVAYHKTYMEALGNLHATNE